MASRLLSQRVRNGLSLPSTIVEKSRKRYRIQESMRWLSELQNQRAFLGSAKSPHGARLFSTFPVEVRASGFDRDHTDASNSNKDASSRVLESDDIQKVEYRPQHDEPSTPLLGSMLGVDRSLLQYLTDVQELERLVSVVESCLRLSSDDVASWIHPLMLATSNLGSADGAVLTERLLAKCLKLVGSQERNTLEAYMDLPYPSAEMYNMAINAWSRAGTRNCARRATQLLALMSQEYRRGLEWTRELNATTAGEVVFPVLSPRPDLFNYTTVMNSWGKSGTKRGVLQAQNMLEELEHLSGVAQILSENEDETRTESPLAYLTPDKACYNAVITGWARSSHYEATSRIESLMQRMDTLHERTGDARFQPDTRSFQMLIAAYAKAAQQRRGKRGNEESMQAALQAENVLRLMCERYDEARRKASRGGDDTDEEELVKPDIMIYNGVLSALANSASLEGARRAEDILLGMLRESSSLDDFPFIEGILPNEVTFNIIIDAWAKSGDSQAGIRAEKLVGIMESCQLRANTITFNALMNAWSRSDATDAGERVDAILKYMLEDEGDARPNVISFSTAIFAWGRSQNDDGALRAEDLLEQMESIYREYKDESLRPNEACYDGVIFAWLRRSGNRNQYDGRYAAERAEAMLNRMNPGLKQYNRVLNAWMKHESDDLHGEEPNKVDRAKSLLQEMSCNATEQKRSNRGPARPPRPDVFAYNYVIGACASTTTQVAERKRDAFFTAVDTYNSLCDSSECSPNNHTYRMMFDVCVKLFPRSNDAQTEFMEKLFRECCNDGLLSNDILRIARNYLPPWSMQKLLGPDVVLSGRKPLYVSDLPEDWSRSFAKKKRSR